MSQDQINIEAVKRIEKIKSSGAKELNLSNLSLVQIPETLKNQTHLVSLAISHNQLTDIPEWIGNFTELVDLKLAGNKLFKLPESMKNLKKLRSLSLASNQFTTLPEWIGEFTQITSLNVSGNRITHLPKSMENLKQLHTLSLAHNSLSELPEYFNAFRHLRVLNISFNKLTKLSDWIGSFSHLEDLRISHCDLGEIPKAIFKLKKLQILHLVQNRIIAVPEEINLLEALKELNLSDNKLLALPSSLAQLNELQEIKLTGNQLNPEISEAYSQGVDNLKAYLRANIKAQTILNESKLILVGEGEVGKTCLMDALLDNPWEEHSSTHGIQIKSVNLTDANSQKEITLNAWDFGGQRVYRPTHQLFFSAPAVYLVVWKPREGPQQGFVKEWIQLVKRREPSAKIIVVATHGGPQQRQPDIDRQELWDLFGKDTVVDFFFVDSKPDENGERKGIEELKVAIARVAAELPEVGRSVPKSFADVRTALAEKGVPYLPLDEVLAICRAHNMDDEIARLFITISHRLGHLTHYENDPALHNIVILRPDWLATAMSYVLDDKETRANQGLVKFSRLSQLWNDPARPEDTRYPEDLHRIFLRLMERFDLSYRVAGLSKDEETNPISLIAQLVPDTTPGAEKYNNAWGPEPAQGDIQQTQICRIVDAQSGQSANAEGLFYQLIVRLHKFSLGRTHWDNSVHWQRGLILDADYNGRALLRHIGNDVHITVRAPYPERFLGMLTEEVKYLVESFWEGLRCDVTVPCLVTSECKGLFEVSKLLENLKRDRKEQPCPICNEWQIIGQLLSNAPDATKPISIEMLARQFASIQDKLDVVDTNTQRIMSQIDKTYTDLLKVLLDEAKEGPRLFSLIPFKRSGFNPKEWASEKFKLILWCEHIRLPLPVINGKDSIKGVYDIELTREWFKKSAPLLKLMTGALSLALPIAASGLPLAIDKAAYAFFKDSIDFSKNIIDATLSASDKAELWKDQGDDVDLPQGIGIRTENAALRELQSFLKTQDPGFGGLVKVLNKHNEFLWVHEKFASEY